MMIKKKIIIKGPRVHGVGYRLFLLEEAEALLIPNLSARNIENKTQIVEVLVGGEEEAVDKFVGFSKKKFPKDADVASVSVEDYDGVIRATEAFSRSLSVSQLSKMARTGNALLETQIGMRGGISEVKGDIKKMLTGQDEHIKITKEGFERLAHGQEEILAKQDEHIGITKDGFEGVTRELKGFGELHEEVRELREKFTKLEKSVARIERKIEA